MITTTSLPSMRQRSGTTTTPPLNSIGTVAPGLVTPARRKRVALHLRPYCAGGVDAHKIWQQVIEGPNVAIDGGRVYFAGAVCRLLALLWYCHLLWYCNHINLSYSNAGCVAAGRHEKTRPRRDSPSLAV